jgi:hypothetical protein
LFLFLIFLSLITLFIVFKILTAVDTKQLKLTKIDDAIYSDFREKFPDTEVAIADPDKLKSPESKEVVYFN